MVAAGGDIKDGKEICRLTGGGEHGGGAALQGADLRRHLVVGGILEPGVKITLGLQIEEGPHGLPGGIPEGGGLDNGNVAGLSTPGDVARVEAVGTGLILDVYKRQPEGTRTPSLQNRNLTLYPIALRARAMHLSMR